MAPLGRTKPVEVILGEAAKNDRIARRQLKPCDVENALDARGRLPFAELGALLEDEALRVRPAQARCDLDPCGPEFEVIAMFRTDTLSMAGGAVHDPVGALLLCASDNADYTVVNGRVVVRQGQITTVDMGPLIERHNQLAMQLALGVN
jgi:hypothetical protein